MTDQKSLLAVFSDLEPAAEAIEQLRTLGVHDDCMNVISGIPVTEAMLGRPEPVDATSRALRWAAPSSGSWRAPSWPLSRPSMYQIQVGGQGSVPGPPTVVVLFELTMLGMLLSTFLGVFLDSTFPSYRPMKYVTEVSDGKIAILIECPQADEKKVDQRLEKTGRRIRAARGGATPMRLFKQLLVVFGLLLAVLAGALMLFTYDVIKIEWVSFMGLQPSYRQHGAAPARPGAFHSHRRPGLHPRHGRSEESRPGGRGLASRAARSCLPSIAACVTVPRAWATVN